MKTITLDRNTYEFAMAEIREVHRLVNTILPPQPGQSMSQRVARLVTLVNVLIEAGIEEVK